MQIEFPCFTGTRCLMMPYIQGDASSVPAQYRKGYEHILNNVFLEKGKTGFLTIDESRVHAGNAHRGARAKYGRALHTEAGLVNDQSVWGTNPSWGGFINVRLDDDLQILIANNLSGSCAVWDAEERDTSSDGDIGDRAEKYPYLDAHFMKAGEVRQIGIFTPHESIPVTKDFDRQFLRIVGDGVYGREPYFTENPLM